MAKKYYAVRKGLKQGIYLTWAECQKHTNGYSGAEFKSFKTMAEAEAYVSNEIGTPGQHITDSNVIAEAYVDGSYDVTTHRYAGGAVVLIGEQEIHISEAGSDPSLASMRNVAGELLGAIRAMEWVEAHMDALGIQKLLIYHDYEGIAKWANGAWQAKKEGTQDYVRLYKKYAAIVPIEFVKVLAHSGDHYNEIADQLAKKALGL